MKKKCNLNILTAIFFIIIAMSCSSEDATDNSSDTSNEPDPIEVENNTDDDEDSTEIDNNNTDDNQDTTEANNNTDISTEANNNTDVSNDNQDTIEIDNNTDVAMEGINCSESSFPNLGPGATRGQVVGCEDVTMPNNIGTLDCRSESGGYSNSGLYGKYEINGSNKRFDGTRTRVERFFNRVSRNRNTSSELSYQFIIDDLSDDQTCIVQSHATGQILAGERVGQTARSAVFLLYATKTNDPNEYSLHVHESTIPFTSQNRGVRTITFLRNIKKGVEYNLTYRTGYNESNNAFSTIRVFRGADSQSMNLNHSYTSESVTTRYGAYEASDSGTDRSVSIRIRNTNFCRL